MVDLLSLACAGLTGIGLAQAAGGWLALRRFVRRPAAAPVTRPPVTVLKPLYGDEPLLEEALSSLCAQDYPGLQVVFGVQDPTDPALRVLRRLRARFPALDMEVVVDAALHGSNRKVGNLINMLPAAKHDLLVIADSDIHAAPGYVDDLVAALAQPGVGLVTTLYVGRPATETLSAQLGAAYINHAFLPGALLARAMGREDCLGATMALTRETLARVGGLPALADHLADDAILGQLVRAQGLSVALARTVPETTVAETQVPALFQHELRWARTVQSLVPAAFVASVVQYPLFWAVLTLGVSGGEGWAWALFAGSWLARGVIANGTDRLLRVASPLTIWCLPFRDLLSVTVMLASYGSDRVAWRGHEHRVTSPSFTKPGLAPGEG
ncbi:MAG: bacteriohopanetetrol glucosamine biosynthesis glycosyltransferase HpnI [Acetobacteraceae bacterium]